MPSTANYAFPTPPLTGVDPNVPSDMKDLADAVDATLKTEHDARIAASALLMSSRRHAASTNIVTDTWTKIPYDQNERNDIPWTAGSSFLFTIAVTGAYQVNAGCLFVNNNLGYRGIRIVTTGNNVRAQQISQPGNTSGGLGMCVSRMIYLTAGDTLWIECRQTSGGTIALAPTSGQVYVDLTLAVRPPS